VATLDECREALDNLAGRLAGSDGRHSDFDRSLSCTVPDLGVTFSGQLAGGHLRDITTEPAPRAQIRLTASSDDLVALTNGQLDFTPAWLSGRVKLEAGMRDLLKLRSML
jgi:predicted lipid carrier protein YhbT